MAEKIIDACCLINLYSTGMEATILRACADEFHVSTQVQNEALTIRQFNDEDPPQLVSQPIDPANLISDDLVSRCEPEGEDETDAFVQFATLLDDGEASCLAIAKTRGWTVATDDRKATPTIPLPAIVMYRPRPTGIQPQHRSQSRLFVFQSSCCSVRYSWIRFDVAWVFITADVVTRPLVIKANPAVVFTLSAIGTIKLHLPRCDIRMTKRRQDSRSAASSTLKPLFSEGRRR